MSVLSLLIRVGSQQYVEDNFLVKHGQQRIQICMHLLKFNECAVQLIESIERALCKALCERMYIVTNG